MINVDTQIDTQFGFGAISNTPTHSVYILKFFSKEDNSEDKVHSITVEKYTANEGWSSNSLGPTETEELSLPLPCPYIKHWPNLEGTHV